MHKNIPSEIAIGVVLILTVAVGGAVWFEGKEQCCNRSITQPVVGKEKKIVDLAAALNGQVTDRRSMIVWKKYVSSTGSLSFEYPTKDCSGDEGPCSDVKLIYDINAHRFAVGSVRNEDSNGNMNEFIEPSLNIYYGVNVNSRQDVNKYLGDIFNDRCSVLEWGNSKDTVESVKLTPGCCLVGQDAYMEKHPYANWICGKVRAYYAKNSNEFVLFVLGSGGGCSFADCLNEEKIAQSIKLDNVSVYNSDLNNNEMQ